MTKTNLTKCQKGNIFIQICAPSEFKLLSFTELRLNSLKQYEVNMKRSRQVFECKFREIAGSNSSSVCLHSIMFSLVVCAVQTVLCAPAGITSNPGPAWTAALPAVLLLQEQRHTFSSALNKFVKGEQATLKLESTLFGRNSERLCIILWPAGSRYSIKMCLFPNTCWQHGITFNLHINVIYFIGVLWGGFIMSSSACRLKRIRLYCGIALIKDGSVIKAATIRAQTQTPITN